MSEMSGTLLSPDQPAAVVAAAGQASRKAADLALWSARQLAAAAFACDPVAVERSVRTAHYAYNVELSGRCLPLLVQFVMRRPLPGWRFAPPGWRWPTVHECVLLELLGRLQAGENQRAAALLERHRCGHFTATILERARCYATELTLGGLTLPATTHRPHGLRVVK